MLIRFFQRIKKNRRSLFSILLGMSVFLCLFFQNCSKPNAVNESSVSASSTEAQTSLQGTWTRSQCQKSSLGGFTETYEYASNGNFIVKIPIFNTATCNGEPLVILELTGTYQLGVNQNDPSSTTITHNPASNVNFTSYFSSGASILNETQFCGVSNWQQGLTVPIVTGSSCLNDFNLPSGVTKVQFINNNLTFMGANTAAVGNEFIYQGNESPDLASENLSGTYLGNETGTQNGVSFTQKTTIVINRSGNSLTGTFDDGNGNTGTFTATLANDAIPSFTATNDPTNPLGSCQFFGSGNFSGSSISVSLQGQSANCGTTSATLTATKVPQASGL